jgi:hypothetical protein
MQKQRSFTTEDNKSTHPNEPKLGSPGAPDTEEGKTLPLIHGKPGQVNTDEQERVKQRVEELVGKLGETYDELIRLMDENPAVARHVTGTTANHKTTNHKTANHEEVDRRLKSRLELADATPRCRWIKQGGTTCGSPQMKNHIYCFAHTQMAEAQALALRLPPPEDANAIQVGLMRIQKALIEDTITTRKAGLLLYSMQLALTNVGQTTFGQAKDEELVRETVDEEEALSSQRSAFSERQNQNQQQRPFTAKDAKDAKENQGLPLIRTDDSDTKGLPRLEADVRGVQQRTKQIEWRPSADMYRMDTREGREAYEATLRPKIARPCAEGIPPQPAIPPHPAQERRGSGTPVMGPDEGAGTHYSSLRDERLPKGPRSANEPLDADTGAGSVLRTETHAILG